MAGSRTNIRLRLTPEGSNALGGAEWATLDLAPDFSFRLSKDVESLSDVNVITTEGVLPFTVPFSTVNDLAMMMFSSPVIVDNPMDGIEARADTDGVQIQFDRIYFRGKSNTSRQWELEFRRSPNHWLELASTKQLCTIDYGSDTLGTEGVGASWENPVWADGEIPTTWPPIDYAGWVDLAEPVQFTDPPVKSIWVEDLRPLISVPYTLKTGFCEIGWTLRGLILETEWFNSLWMYILSREYYTVSKGGIGKLVGAYFGGDFSTGSLIGFPILYDSIEYDPGVNALVTPTPGLYYAGLTNPLPFKGKYKFCFTGFAENTAGTSAILSFHVYEFVPATGLPTGNVITGTETVTVEFSAGETKYITACLEVELEVGQDAVLWVENSDTVELKKGYHVTIEPNNKSLVRGDEFEVKDLVSCEENYTLLNLFKGVQQIINARIETDFENRIVTLHPYRVSNVNGTTVPGFIDESSHIDLEGKVICDSVKVSPVKNSLTRFTRLQFADTTDAYIDNLDLAEPSYSRKVLNGIELPDKITELQNPFFEATLEERNDELKKYPTLAYPIGKPTPYLPRMWDNMNGERSFNIGPRILFHFGYVRQVDEVNTVDVSAVFYFEGAAIDLFGYCTQKRTLEVSTNSTTLVAPHMDGSIIFGTLPFDLYVTYYLGTLLAQRRGSLVDVLVWMSATDYQNWNFRNAFLFNYEGAPVKGLPKSIRDFAPATDLPTPVTMLVEPMMTTCCDLPCSCRFTECDYYQDFGAYMAQVTLDDLAITSFKVNGIEQLAADVQFGIISVVQISGRQFVTNLVDALNGIGLDYFFFKASTKIYSGKDDLRFFKIKRPSCWSFEIIISDSGGEVYRYRDYDLHQQWFDATWTAFGYGGDPIDEPQDCVTTVEY